MLYVLLIIFIIVLFSIFFLCLGSSLLIAPDLERERGVPVFLCCSYFLGMASFLSIWRLLGFMTGNLIGAVILAIGFSLIIVRQFRGYKYFCVNIELNKCLEWKWIIIVSAGIICFVHVYWLMPIDELGPFSMIGSLHSPRYANIAIHMWQENRIPVIGQNYGQSMLAVIPMIFGLKSPLLSLSFWLSITMSFFTFLIYSLFRYFNLSHKFSMLSTFVMLFGNTAFSFFHILTIDSGSPFVMNGYTDSIASIGSFICFLFFINGRLPQSIPSLNVGFKEILFIFSLAVYFNISAPQNSIFFSEVMLCIIGFNYIKNKLSFVFFIKLFLLFLLFSIVGIFTGGMFAPSCAIERLDIQGLMVVAKTKGINLDLGIPFHIGIGGNWVWGQTTLNLGAVFFVEQVVSNSIKVVFWPLFGVVLSFYLFRTVRKISNAYMYIYRINLTAILILFLGLFLNAFFNIDGFKWELTRFLILGYFLGMFTLLLSLNFLHKKHILSRFLLLFIASFLTFGPVVNSVYTIGNNLQSQGILYEERLQMLVNYIGFK
jgi:hypothetical protein